MLNSVMLPPAHATRPQSILPRKERDIELGSDMHGETPLFEGLKKANCGSAKLLVLHGADFNARDNSRDCLAGLDGPSRQSTGRELSNRCSRERKLPNW
jgi:hypothetical protein